MKMRFLQAAAGWMAAVAFFVLPIQAMPVTWAASSILLDSTTGRVLYSHSADTRSLIASTTKIMTGLLIAEECDPRARVCVPKEAVGVEGSSIYLKEGEVLTVEALLYGMMLHSGNDAAVTLAMYSAGSVPAFAEKMNRKAEELGLLGTNYVNPHGLDETGHYSTAADLAKLTAYAMENQLFRQIVSTKTAVFGDRVFTNHNKLLWKYPHAVGVKTGYTRSAGRILVSAAERDGRRLIAVTINDKNDWQDHISLLEYGFSRYTMREILQAGRPVGSVPVLGGAEEEVRAVVTEDFSYPVSAEETVELCPNLPLFVYAPVLAGEPAGTVSVIIDGAEVTRLPVCWQFSVLEEA